MGKSIFFFGQSVFGQLISLVDRPVVNKAVKEQKSDYGCKGFYTWDHLISMLFCTIGGCNSLREISAAFLGLKGKTQHLALNKLPKRSTLSDANKKRNPKVFERIYNGLLGLYLENISDSRIRDKFKRKVFLIDSTTITLFCAIMRSAGRIPKSGKQKGGIKVHTLLNADELVPKMIWITESATNDVNFLSKIEFESDAVYVFDKGYIDYERYETLSNKGVYFVSRLRENAAYKSLQELEITDETDAGVMKDELIELPVRKNGKIIRTVTIRKIAYWDAEHERTFEFITNLLDIDPFQIALLYKQRWQIEILFKQVKQNFPLKYFLGDNKNAIEIQVWCTLIANLLMTVIQKSLKRRWSFSNMVSFCRIHMFNQIHLLLFFENPEKDWEKEHNSLQIEIFSG